jgi:hypothetical protein
VGITPLPEIKRLSGLEAALVVMRNVSVKVVSAVGVKTIETLQELLAPSEAPQVLAEIV